MNESVTTDQQTSQLSTHVTLG